MKFSPIIILVAFFGSFYSCKKEKLEGEKSILIGEWEWVATTGYEETCDPDFMYPVLFTPSTEGTSYQMNFLERGCVEFYSQNSFIEKHRVVFDAFGAPACDVYYEIYLDNSNLTILNGCISEDTLVVLDGFPYPDQDCEIYTSYFVRK